MLAPLSALPELRLADLLTLLAVQRTSSISGAARELCVTPSQVSKAIARLEKHFGARILTRGARGVTPTAAGRRILPRVASAVEELRATARMVDGHAASSELTVAGPSYLVAHVLPAVAALVPGTRLRGLEMAPAYLRACVAENVFDVALTPGGIDEVPSAWTSDDAGRCRIVLLARPEYVQDLAPLPLTADRVRPLPFVGPTKTGGDRFVALTDDCPLPWEERWIAHEVQTIGAALEFASRTDNVVFGPAVAARRFLATGALVEIPVEGWDVRAPVHLLCNGDRVLSRVRGAVLRAARELFEDRP
jgi:DNA-binding transcriptional LysR family regulator